MINGTDTELIMTHITVGIDGSTGSTRALEWAAAESSLTGCDLEIVHAVDLPRTGGIFTNTAIGDKAITEMSRFSQDLLDIAARRAAEVAPDVRMWTRTEVGSPAAVLSAASSDAEAVVVGSRGLGAFESFIGSVSVRVATRAGCPVFVIPDQDTEPSRGGPIVVGVDDSEYGAAALRFALQEALLRKTSIRAVTAYQLPMVSVPLQPGVMTSFEQDEHERALATIEKLLDQVRTDETNDVKTESAVVQGPTVEGILAHANDAQLIVVGSHGRGMVRRLLLGSVSRRLLYETDRPVAVVDLPH
ncbi:universal stress protein [Microlunatus sp. Gsoil 973]|uniref:universal stress protein n=1 Tax=Microlunatus sp. Gsoil 973 TaxID=2672569 RepID=UPI0018A80323|nr:universal stress protein [Microlunatus sp. Gsoil 973]